MNRSDFEQWRRDTNRSQMAKSKSTSRLRPDDTKQKAIPMKKKTEETNTAPAAPAPSAPAAQRGPAIQSNAATRATYSNFCRVTGTPEEVIMDFALNPNAFGQVMDEALVIDHRIVMGYQAAKRTAMAFGLHRFVRVHGSKRNHSPK